MKVGCFALIHPFQSLEAQLDQIRSWGFRYADLTDNSDGACLGSEFGFAAIASLDANPFDLKRRFEFCGLAISSICAHANLLDPVAPWRYGTAQIIKAVRTAAAIDVRHVITTEGEPSTEFGRSLNDAERIFSIREKLIEPLRVAADYDVKILLEPHGPISGSVSSMERIIDACDSSALGINLDTGNLWLGGGDPIEMVHKLGSRIEHVHWKDLPAEMASKRGTLYGCGMATIPLGTGAVDIKGVYTALVETGFEGHTTLEIAGEGAVKGSYAFLRTLGIE